MHDRLGIIAGRMHELLVVILNYNTRELLRNCLASLHDQHDVDFVTCVVDNASSDRSAAMVKEEFPEVHLIPSNENIGYPAGNNLGLRAFGFPGRGEAHFVMLLNPDTVVPKGALRKMLDYAAAHADVGALGPRLLLEDGTLDKACRRSFPTPEVSFYRLTGLSRLFPRSRRFGRYNLTYLNEQETNDVDSLVGACMLVRGEALAKAGLLDERFFMYGEDLDWCLRIKQAGYRVVYFADVIVHHIKRAASRGSQKAQFEFVRAQWLFYAKHYAGSTHWLVDKLVRMGLSLRGGPLLAREIAQYAGR
jgi:GT2 family glycosyltransferase